MPFSFFVKVDFFCPFPSCFFEYQSTYLMCFNVGGYVVEQPRADPRPKIRTLVFVLFIRLYERPIKTITIIM